MIQSTNNETVCFGSELHIPEPTTTEVYDTVRKMKDSRAPGEDTITAELIKKLGKRLWENIHQLTVSIWNKEEIPEKWRTAIIYSIYKKGSKLECKNYSGISLLTVTYKIFTNILSEYLKVYADEIIGEYQGGFRKGRSILIIYSHSDKY
jgi:hypothetical protein